MFWKKDQLKNVETEVINEIDIETKEEKRLFKVLNIVLIIVVVLAIIISVDIVCVNMYNKGPFFAIRTQVYKDGGTKVYYGLGYKVIKYHQKQGRRDTEIGFWTMPYSITPTKISTLDLAIELRNKPKATYKKYAKQFLQVIGEIYEVDEKRQTLTLRYTDEGKKYTLDVVCHMAEMIKEKDFALGDETIAMGSVSKYTIRDSKKKNSVNTLEMKNCFVK